MTAPVLAFDRAGDGPRVLLLHGLGGERHTWEPVWPALTAACDVLTLDMPGFGGSASLPAGSDVSPAGLARAIASFLDAEGFARPHVAGNSLGAWVGLELARLGVARSVTALCPAGFWARTAGPAAAGPRRVLAALRPLFGVALAVPALRRRALAGVMVHPERVGYRAALRLVGAYAHSPGYATVQPAMRGRRVEDGAGIDVPVTLAWGERDSLVWPERVALTPTRTVVLRDAGHVPMWDVPAEITRLVIEDSLATEGA